MVGRQQDGVGLFIQQPTLLFPCHPQLCHSGIHLGMKLGRSITATFEGGAQAPPFLFLILKLPHPKHPRPTLLLLSELRDLMRSRYTNVFPSGPLKVVLFIDSCCTGQAECIHHFTVHNAMVHILWLLSFNLEGSGQ